MKELLIILIAACTTLPLILLLLSKHKFAISVIFLSIYIIMALGIGGVILFMPTEKLVDEILQIFY